jgi:hypothetical protein
VLIVSVRLGDVEYRSGDLQIGFRLRQILWIKVLRILPESVLKCTEIVEDCLESLTTAFSHIISKLLCIITLSLKQESVEVLMEERTFRSYGHAVRMDLERRPKLVREDAFTAMTISP